MLGWFSLRPGNIKIMRKKPCASSVSVGQHMWELWLLYKNRANHKLVSAFIDTELGAMRVLNKIVDCYDSTSKRVREYVGCWYV